MAPKTSKNTRSIAVGVETHRRAKILTATRGGTLRQFIEGFINREFEEHKTKETKNNAQITKS